MISSHSSKCESSVESAPSAVMRATSWTVEEIFGHEISTVITLVSSRIPLPIPMAADLERNRSDTSLRLTFQEEFFGEQKALTTLPFLDTEITEFILATTST